jgi:UDP-N-acetylglucosamine--N-acetylmuramyl-(pentapeptide) pyrophosphoryl-undecaprenol N-acetylglucosamine transferase
MSTPLAPRCALIMAGGTGGHIFPALALAEALRGKGWRVHWLGGGLGMNGNTTMEQRLVPPCGFAFEGIAFSGVRGKGVLTLVKLPFNLLRAAWQCLQVMRRVRPNVVVGFGGYVTFPGGLMGRLTGRPLVLHEQNSIAGMSNRWLAKIASRVFTAFPKVLQGAEWIGNPLRAGFLQQAPASERFASRSGPLKLLVLGGSLGAKALNDTVPQALALIPQAQRPIVTHQSGEKQIAELRANYERAGVQATLTPFIDDTAQAMAEADVMICRAGASTVTEIAAVGVPAMFVPFPFAVDDHQTHNAKFLCDHGAGTLVQQKDLSAAGLAQWLQNLNRSTLLAQAQAARAQAKLHATDDMVRCCEELCP